MPIICACTVQEGSNCEQTDWGALNWGMLSWQKKHLIEINGNCFKVNIMKGEKHGLNPF